MTTKERIAMIETVVQAVLQWRLLQGNMRMSIGDCFDSYLDKYVGKTLNSLICATSAAIGDTKPDMLLAWYIWDNDCGSRGMKYECNDGFRQIRSPRQLLNVIDECNKR